MDKLAKNMHPYWHFSADICRINYFKYQLNFVFFFVAENDDMKVKMAHMTYLLFIVLIKIGISTEDEANMVDTDVSNSIAIDDYLEYNKTNEYYDYNTTEILRKPISVTNDSHKKCDVINSTSADDSDFIPTKMLSSVYLENHSNLTSNLIEAKLSADGMEIDGVNLFDVVNSDCGGAKVCPNVSGNWTNDNTITVGFLGAYGRSQVSVNFNANLCKRNLFCHF